MPASDGITKICSKCKDPLSVSAFCKDRSKPDGLYSWCRKCLAEDNRTYRRENREQVLERHRAYKQTEAGKESFARYRTNNPEKIKASNAVNQAIRTGRLMKQPCEVCGEVEVHGHHDSYAPEDRLKVRWLCHVHHMEYHRE